MAITLHEDQCMFMIMSRRSFLKMSAVSGRSCRENQNTCFVFNNFFLNRAFYETTRENMVDQDRPKVTILFGACALHAG